MSPKDLLTFLASHPAGAIGTQHISKPDSPQTQGVIATTVEHLHPIRAMLGLIPQGGGISLREWLRDGTGWLFLPYLPAYSSLLAPLFTALVNLLMTEVLMLPDYPSRRIFFVLDELGNLLKLQKLSQLVAVGRSKGAAVILGTQTIAKLNARYGPEVVKDIMNNCNLKLIFRLNDPDSARFAEQLLGTVEAEEKRRTDSLGVLDYKDGVSISTYVTQRSIVLASEFMHLPNLTCFIKIFDLFPARDEVKFKKFTGSTHAFVKREIPEPVPEVNENPTSTEKQLKPQQTEQKKSQTLPEEREKVTEVKSTSKSSMTDKEKGKNGEEKNGQGFSY